MTKIEMREGDEKVNERCVGLLAEQDDLSERKRIGVCDRQLRGSSTDRREASSGTAMQPQLRRTARLSHDFDVPPQHPLRVAGAQRFHRGFLGCEPPGEMNRGVVASHAVGDFRVREDTVGKPLAVPFDRCSDTRDVRRVQAKSDDGHAPTA